MYLIHLTFNILYLIFIHLVLILHQSFVYYLLLLFYNDLKIVLNIELIEDIFKTWSQLGDTSQRQTEWNQFVLLGASVENFKAEKGSILSLMCCSRWLRCILVLWMGNLKFLLDKVERYRLDTKHSLVSDFSKLQVTFYTLCLDV